MQVIEIWKIFKTYEKYCQKLELESFENIKNLS